MTRLLIMACSARKRATEDLLPAIDRYDGPAFRVLRKYLSHAERPGLTVMILSAKYCLLGPVSRSETTTKGLRPSVFHCFGGGRLKRSGLLCR